MTVIAERLIHFPQTHPQITPGPQLPRPSNPADRMLSNRPGSHEPGPEAEPRQSRSGHSGRGTRGSRKQDRQAPLPDAALVLLDRSSAGLLQACATADAAERYVAAHLAALRSAAAVIAVRGQGKSRRGGPRSVWELLHRVAPELNDWATYFSTTAARRAAIEAGRSRGVSAAEADSLLLAAESFQHAVEALFALPQYPILPASILPCADSPGVDSSYGDFRDAAVGGSDEPWHPSGP